MAPLDYDRVSLLLERLLALPPEARQAYLETECGGDHATRNEVSALAAADAKAATCFDRLAALVIPPALAALSKDGPGDALLDGETVGNYTILEELGRGGMGVVYKARDERLDRFVALKFLPAHLSADPVAKARFIREARAASALDHPNIAVVHEVGETESGRLFLVMRYYEGETLEERCRRSRVPLDEALSVAAQLASALAAAHAHGIRHRDVKPSNILITRDGVTKLLDFGVAQLGDAGLAAESVAAGTVAYMSPEQTRGAAHDHRTDLWSVGVVLYEMLAARRPFRAGDEEGLLRAIREADCEPIQRLDPEVPAPVAQILARCLAKDVDRRYRSAEELSAALAALAESRRRAPRVRGRRRLLLQYGGAASLLATLAGSLAYMERRVPDEPTTRSPTSPSTTRIAVLPLSTSSEEPEDRLLANGITTDVVDQLSQVGWLRVIARSSVTSYAAGSRSGRSIAEELGVDSVLEGSVRLHADRVEVTVHLLDAATLQRSWTGSASGFASDLPALPQEIVRRVVEALQVGFARGANEWVQVPAPPVDAGAYRLYLKGRHLLDRADPESARQAHDSFQRALDIEPTFARGWAGVADAFHALVLFSSLPPEDAYPRMRAAAERALQIDPALAEAHVSLGIALSHFYWDFGNAARHYRRALELNPSHAAAHRLYAEHLRYQGQFADALRAAEQAERLDPLSPMHSLEPGIILYLARKYDEAIARFRRLLDVNPRFAYARFFVALAQVQLGKHEAALATLAEGGPGLQGVPDVQTLRAYIHAATGRREQARRILDAMPRDAPERRDSNWHRAMVHIALGEHDRAVDLLEQAYEDRLWQLRLLPVEPLFDPVRSHARFERLAARFRTDDFRP